MSAISRQLHYQRKHKAAGLCSFCSEPSAFGSVRCVKHMTTDRAYRHARGVKPWKFGDSGRPPFDSGLRSRWDNVDWNKPVKQIAQELSVTKTTVYYQRNKRNKKK